MRGTVERLVAGGDGLVRIDREVFLVPDVVPGDEVELRPADSKRGARRARVVRLLAPSRDRVEPPCAWVDRCGGCPLMRIEEAAQRRAKGAILAEALRLDRPIDVVPGPALGYRSRARLRWSRGRVGYVRHGSREVVDVDVCAVLAPPLARGLAALREIASALGPSGEARLVAAAGGGVAATLAPDADPGTDLFRAIERLVSEGRLRGAAIVSGGASRAVIGDATGEAQGGDGRSIAVDPDGFSQPCDAVVPVLAQSLLAAIDPSPADRVLELYAGAGTWTVAIAQRVGTVVAVESDARAAGRLAQNAAARGLSNVVVRRETAQAALASPGKSPTVVVLDPPRTGAREVVGPIVALGARRIAYVSCDPATLGRDVRLFGEAGWRPTGIQAFDLMPQTAEVEALVVLERGRIGA